jgi:carboxymethylenebutenolidase
LSFERKQAIANKLVDFMRGLPEVRDEPLALIGFSMGGSWALELASYFPEDIGKAVLFYGAGEGDFAKIKAEILGHFSDTDEWEDISFVRSMESDLRNAGVSTTLHIYPSLPHWFFEEDRPEFDPQGADVAWKRTLEFLRK